MCDSTILNRLQKLNKSGRWMVAFSIGLTVLGVWVAYGLDHRLSLTQQVLAHLVVIIFPVGLKIGYVIMLYAQQQLRQCSDLRLSQIH
ncbi:hypothetical protein ACVBEJ_01150 [Porticoccus sp. GXU_MW_L64]